MEHTDLELYIQIRDGQPHEHPIFADNFRAAFPDVDTANLPDTFAKFVRVDVPVLNTYEVYEGVTYQWVDGVVKDVHSVRPMTDEEQAAKTRELEAAAEQLAQLRASKEQRAISILSSHIIYCSLTINRTDAAHQELHRS